MKSGNSCITLIDEWSKCYTLENKILLLFIFLNMEKTTHSEGQIDHYEWMLIRIFFIFFNADNYLIVFFNMNRRQ